MKLKSKQAYLYLKRDGIYLRMKIPGAIKNFHFVCEDTVEIISEIHKIIAILRKHSITKVFYSRHYTFRMGVLVGAVAMGFPNLHAVAIE